MSSTTSLDTEQLHALVPLSATLGIRLSEATAERVRLELDWRDDLCTAGGVLHGGALMTLADSVGAACAVLNLPKGAATSTIESKTNFFRGVRSGSARAVARPLHVGRMIVVVQTDTYDDDGRRVGQTTQTQAVIRP